MGVGSGGQRGRGPSGFHTWYTGTDIVDRGLIVLLSVFLYPPGNFSADALGLGDERASNEIVGSASKSPVTPPLNMD